MRRRSSSSHSYHYPCLHCHPHTYIRMVQHLIERCLLFRMDRDQCIKVLAEQARIHHLVTLTVWRQLLNENRDFFEAYFESIISSSRRFLTRTMRARFGRKK